MSFNEKIFFQIYNAKNTMPWLDKLGIFFAQYSGYGLLLALAYLLFKKPQLRTKMMIFEGLVAAIIARFGIVTGIRMLYYHPRPFNAGIGVINLIPEGGASFPSGHAAFFFALSTTIFLYNRKLGYFFYAVSAVMGIARIFVGVHWPLDILGGAVVGIGVALVVHPAARHWLPKFFRSDD